MPHRKHPVKPYENECKHGHEKAPKISIFIQNKQVQKPPEPDQSPGCFDFLKKLFGK